MWAMDELAKSATDQEKVKIYRDAYKLSVWVGAIGWALFLILVFLRCIL